LKLVLLELDRLKLVHLELISFGFLGKVYEFYFLWFVFFVRLFPFYF
jgi:hypothetical protein